MSLYRSLVYREFKLTKKHSIMLVGISLVLMALMLLLCPVYGEIENDDDIASVTVMSLTFAFIVSAMGASSNDIPKKDIAAGWRRYMYILPVTPAQQAAADILTKLISIAVFFIIKLIHSIAVYAIMGVAALPAEINAFLICSSAFLIYDMVYNLVIMLARDKKQLKKFGMIAGLAGVAVFILVPDLLDPFDKSTSEGATLAYLKAMIKHLSSLPCTFIAIAVFIAVNLLYFFLLKRAYERREP